MKRLEQVLSYKRPYGSKSEAEMVANVITSQYPEHTLVGPMENIVIEVGEGSRTLFSCHTDTVHHTEGTQRVRYSSVTAWKNDKEPLGADDGAGVWLLLHMIDAGVPGTYVFHRGEERGGIGSSWMAKHAGEWLAQFDRAVAFDRKGSTSVITHQFGGRCCSDKFAKSLAEALGMKHHPDNTGVFTDTANYTHIIPECTNISVGYNAEHTSLEQLDLTYLFDLAEAVIKVDWEALPTARDITAPEVSIDDIRDFDDLEGLKYDDLHMLCVDEPDTIAFLIAEFFDQRQNRHRRADSMATPAGGFAHEWPLGALEYDDTDLEDELDLQAVRHLCVGLL